MRIRALGRPRYLSNMNKRARWYRGELRAVPTISIVVRPMLRCEATLQVHSLDAAIDLFGRSARTLATTWMR